MSNENNTLYAKIVNRIETGDKADKSSNLFNDEESKILSSYTAGPENVTQFNNNANVIKNYEVVTDYLADSKGFMASLLDSGAWSKGKASEFMRDSTMRVSSLVTQAAKMDDAPEEVKKAYRDLRKQWNDVSIDGGSEWFEFVKDYGTDVVASYETLPIVLSMIFGGPAGGAVSASTHATAKLALHKALSKSANFVGGNTVKSASAYAGGITGIHDLASQDVAVDLGEKENINLAQTAAFTGLGSLFGGGVAYGLRKLTSKTDSNRLVRDLEEDGTGTVNKNNASSVVDEGIEGEWIPASAGTVINEADRLIGGATAKVIDGETVNKGTEKFTGELKKFVNDIGGGEKTFEELETIILGELKSGATGKQIKSNIAFNIWKTSTDLIGNFLGKGAGILTPYTKFSKTAQTLQERLSHEFAEGFKIQKSKVGHDFSEAATNTSSYYNTEYLKIVEPLALNSVKGNLSDDVNDALLAAIRGKKSGNKKIDKAANQIQKLFRNIGNDLHSNGIIEKQVDNYIPRMWNRKSILSNQDLFDEKLVSVGEAKSLTEARRISDGMLDLENQLDGGSGGTFFASKRKFKFTDDSEFTDFLNPDLMDTITQYNFQAGKALAKKKVLLSSNENDFIKNWINPIVEEMKQSGKVLSKKEREQIRSLYRHATGEKMDRFGTAGQVASDGYTLATRLALLPLATVGSITEIFINIGKAGFKNSAKGFAEASEASFSKISGNLHKDLMTRHGLTANEAWRELKKHGIAMEQAQAQIGQRLVGDDLATDSMQKVSNKFFRMNLLDQWTKFVQMTSFASGKNMIKENLETIASHGNNPMNKKIEGLIGELNELNIDYKKGVNWVKGGAKTNDSFYNQVTAGAARYTNSVILQPTAMSGLKPLLHTNPRTTVLFQLLGYPAAFTNTIMKGAVKAAVKAPTRNAPKLFAAGFVMTETARWMNWLRTRGESEKYKEPHEIRLAAIRRWGGNGLLFDNLTRASDAAKYSGNVAGFATAPFGPIANDILNLGSGKFYQTAGSKVPFYAAGNVLLGQENMREYRSLLKEKDKGLKGLIPEFKKDIRREYYDKGGEVDVPNAPKEPDERINKFTGLPYNYEAGSAFMDSNDPEKITRQGFVVGSLVKVGGVALKGFIAEAIDDAAGGLTKTEVVNKAAKQIEQSTGLRSSRVVDDPFDTMDMDMPSAGMLDESDEMLEDYTLNFIKLHLNEKLPDLDDTKGSEILSKFGPRSKEYYNHMGYDQQFKETVEYVEELKDIVDPTGDLSFDISNALTDIYQNKNYLGFSSASQKNLDKIDELGLNEVAEFLSHRLAVDDTVSDIGKVNAVRNELGNKLDDPRFVQVLENLKNSLPSRTSDELTDLLPEKELTNRLEVFVGKSSEKKPQYRAISSYSDLDFDIAFFSPREMGVHVGAQGQAEFIAARAINQNRAVDEFSIPSRTSDEGFDPVTKKEMDEFYESESVRLTDFEEIDWDNISLDEFQKLKTLQDEADVPSLDPNVPPVSMVKGYIQVKNPLVIESDMANWSAENLLTQGSSMFLSSIAKQSKKSMGEITKELKPLMEQAIKQTNNDLTNFAPKPSALVDGVVNNVDLTKKLQKYLEDSGFDSIKYKNEVEPLLETDIPKGYEPYSYILFKPQQYKSIFAKQYNEKDPRFNYRVGGLAEEKIGAEFWADKYNAEERPLEERISDYNDAQGIEVTDTVNNVVDYAVDSGAFDFEIQDLGLTKQELKEGLKNISKIETSGGNLPKNMQVSPTGAQGLFQVIEETARSVIENKQFGPKAAEAAGISLEELKKMNKKELQNFLLNDDRANALFATSVIMQKLQHQRNINKKRTDFNYGGIVR